MTAEAVLWLIAIFYFTTIALILLELQRVLRRICLAIEQNALPVKATSEKLDGLAGLNGNQLQDDGLRSRAVYILGGVGGARRNQAYVGDGSRNQTTTADWTAAALARQSPLLGLAASMPLLHRGGSFGPLARRAA